MDNRRSKDPTETESVVIVHIFHERINKLKNFKKIKIKKREKFPNYLMKSAYFQHQNLTKNKNEKG